jgi:hypothetical protein
LNEGREERKGGQGAREREWLCQRGLAGVGVGRGRGGGITGITLGVLIGVGKIITTQLINTIHNVTQTNHRGDNHNQYSLFRQLHQPAARQNLTQP